MKRADASEDARNDAQSDDKLLTRKQVRAFFGGISDSTLFRGIRMGYFPKAIHVTDKVRRWSKKDCEKFLAHAKTQKRVMRDG